MAKLERKSLDLSLSPYTLLRKDEAGDVQLLNILHGTSLRLGGNELDSLADSPDQLSEEQRQLIDLLIKNKIIESAPGIDKQMYHMIAGSASEKRAWRLGILLDYITGDELAMIPRFLDESAGIPESCPEDVMLYLWIFSDAGYERIPAFTDMTGRLPEGPAGRYIVIHTNLTNPPGYRDIKALERLKVPKNSGIVNFIITEEAVIKAGGSREYCRQIFNMHSQLYSLGFLPHFLLRCTDSSIDFMTEELYRALCFSGVYPRNIYLTFSGQMSDILELTCELYNWDWDLYLSKARQVAMSSMYQVVEPMGRGVADKIRGLLRDGYEPPIIHHCPFAQHSFIFGEKGKVTACPVSQGIAESCNNGASFLHGDFLTGELYHDNIEAWEARSPASIEQCSECRAAPFCGSGCPLSALEHSGNLNTYLCPPVTSILEQEINISYQRAHG